MNGVTTKAMDGMGLQTCFDASSYIGHLRCNQDFLGRTISPLLLLKIYIQDISHSKADSSFPICQVHPLLIHISLQMDLCLLM
ncbi:hypothetical protein VNO77_23179 [Canavalia gladiata]|uniref:Uncharacterized protein n=1 Tax=Canavalia gladiata TaxID=3824 RepID=A0AAN9L7D8_CANGL